MAKSVLIDQFHVTVLVPAGLPKGVANAVVRTLHGPRFDRQLRKAVRGVLRRFRSLAKSRVTVSR